MYGSTKIDNGQLVQAEIQCSLKVHGSGSRNPSVCGNDLVRQTAEHMLTNIFAGIPVCGANSLSKV